MQQIRLLIIAVISFLAVASGGFLRKVLSVALCSTLGFNSCIGYVVEHSQANAALPVPKAREVVVASKNQENPNKPDSSKFSSDTNFAQFDLPIPPIRLPGSGSVEGVIKGVISDQILKALSKVIKDEAPILSSSRDLFPTVSELPGDSFNSKKSLSENKLADASLPLVSTDRNQDTLSFGHYKVGQIPRVRQQNPEEGGRNQPSQPVSEGLSPFRPTGNLAQVISQLRTSRDGSVMLAPGDYSIPMTLLCMKQRASSPRGHRYLLAPLKGSKADVIAALNARAIGTKTPYKPLQVLSWNIQAGIKYEEMSSDIQELVDQLIPDYRQRLSRSFLEQVEATYNQFAGATNLPSLESALDQLGDIGKIIRDYRQFRDTLVRYQRDYDALLSALIPSGASSTVGGAVYTPWSKLSERAYARMITQESAGGKGEFQVRILPIFGSNKSLTDSSNTSAVKVGITNIVADSQNDGIQPLTGAPKSTTEQSPQEPSENSSIPCTEEVVNAMPQVIKSSAKQSVPLILEAAKQAQIDDPGQLAYILSTAQHESSMGKFMNEKYRGNDPRKYFNHKYGSRKDLGNRTKTDDGYNYRGRGYVQITGRTNYQYWSDKLKIDLVNNPDLAARPEVAAKILVYGMRDGSFTGKKLKDYIKKGSKTDFYNARRIVNGIDKADTIAKYSKETIKAIKDCFYQNVTN